MGRVMARFESGRGLAVAAVAALLAVCGWLASTARGYVYWSTCSYGTIGRANLGGTHVEEAFIKNLKNPTAVALGPGYIYWLVPGGAFGSTGSIARANANGTHVKIRLVTPASTIYPSTGAIVGYAIRRALAVDSAHVYYGSQWVESAYIWGEEIGRANLGGGRGHDLIDTSKTQIRPSAAIGHPITYKTPTALATGTAHLYWANPDGNTIGKATSIGKSVDEHFITGAARVTGLAVGVNRTYIYWSSANGTIGRADLNGTHVDHTFIKSSDAPRGVAVDSAYIYWANADGTIGRANLDGTHVNEKFVKGASFACGLAVDDRGPKPKAPAPPRVGITPIPSPLPAVLKPSNTSRPTISGSPYVGGALTASPGGWNGSKPITFQYQWQLCNTHGSCADITAETAATYVVRPIDVGFELRVRVTASNASGASSSMSVPTAKVTSLASTPTTTTTPTTTGTVVTVTAGAPMTYGFTLSALGQTVYSYQPKQLAVPNGAVTFNLTNTLGIGNHNFFVCSTPLTGAAIKTPTISLPQTCTGTGTASLAPGDSATLTVDLTTAGTYEYLSTVGCPTFCDSGYGMIGKLQVT